MTMSAGTSFSRKLKEARLARGLTQADLAGEAYTASYISLLESGRRRPTSAIINELAGRLNVTADELRSYQEPAVSSPSVASIELELQVIRAWRAYDYPLALELASRAKETALTDGNQALWWSMSVLEIECLNSLDRYQAGWEAAQLLRDHHLTRESSNLAAEVEILAAQAKLSMGRLPDAVHHARLALMTVENDPDADRLITIRARLGLVAALAEGDELEEATKMASTLSTDPDDGVPQQLSARILWSAGNIAFLNEDVEDGVRLHDRAIELLSPAADFSEWGRLNLASSAMRINSGLRGHEIGIYLQQAEFALGQVGSTSERLEVAIYRSRWELAKEDFSAAAKSLHSVLEKLDSLAPQTAGEAELVNGQILTAQGHQSEGAQALLRAANFFEQAGAYDRSTEAFKQYVAQTQGNTGP